MGYFPARTARATPVGNGLIGRRRPQLAVRLSYVDVQQPRLADVVAGLDRPAVAVPLLLTSGYHVRVDLPRGLDGAVAAPPLGPDTRLVELLRLDPSGREYPTW
jgi:sirohydrochlorin ferrochelatase